MKSTAILVTVAMVLALTGCAAQYGQAGAFTGGHDETQLAPDMYRVAFAGNDSTGMQRVADFALLRSAEIALEHGYPYFEVIESKQWTDSKTISTPGVSSTAGPRAGCCDKGAGSYTSRSADGTTITENEPNASFVIRLLKTKDDAREFAYESQSVADSLRDKYDIIAE